MQTQLEILHFRLARDRSFVEVFYRTSKFPVPQSTAKPTHRILAALKLRKLSVPKLAQKHGVSDKTLYAVLSGNRPGRHAKVRKAVAEAHLAEEALRHV